ncbi:hypothetical protein ACFVP3_30440 [Streptomyces sp. NPDC057806]|uniref:hypothetical protein n=1 Tax=unclassified Streptomyces TaxID=2593676 RepID=UPI002021F018|nr:hypothetical protein [Streptomyces sp. YS415]MCL7427158.1 hypothetical protein [Streptomyces sp. YS415]
MTTALRRVARLGGSAALLGTLLLGAGTASAQTSPSTAPARQAVSSEQAAGSLFTTWATDVNLRNDLKRVNGWACGESPSTTNCPDVTGQAQPGDQLEVHCQTLGQTIGSNPYWVFVDNHTRGTYGWMASYFIAHPDNKLPGVPSPCMGP